MKKVYSLIISLLIVFISLSAVAMEPPTIREIETALSKSDREIKTFKEENGGNIFHVLFREFQASKGKNETLKVQIVNAVSRFPELLLIPDDDGQYATDFVEGTLLPLGAYQALGQRFKAGVYNETPDPDREKFMKDVAPSLLATIASELMVDSSDLSTKARYSRDPTEQKEAKLALDRFAEAQADYDEFVLNGSQIFLRVSPKGTGVPLFMLPIVDFQRKDFIKGLFNQESKDDVAFFAYNLGTGSALLEKRKMEGRIIVKVIDLATNGYSGLYPAFQKGGGYFDRFLNEEIKDDPDYNDPRFLDGILYAMSLVGHQKDGITPVVSKMQMDQLLVRFPGLREKIKSFPKPFGGLEAYFDEDIKDHRVHILLSRAKTKSESVDPVQFVGDAVSNRWLSLPDYLMNDYDRRKLNTFIDYFRAVSAYHEHRTVNPGFWDYLYSNQHFRHARVNSAAQAFLIGLDVSVHNRDMGRASELEVFQPGIMKALFKKDAEFTGLPAPKGLSTTARVIKLITRANQLMDEMGINSSVEVYQATNDAGFEILNGNSSVHTLNFNRKATKDEFLIAMSFLRKAVLRGKPDSLQGKIIYAPYPESLGGDNLRKLQRHRQNVSLCAAWIMEEGAASVSEAIRLRGVADSMGLSPEEVKNRLYKMEDNFAGYGYFIKDRAALERELD